jgi:hypothetical protein
MSEVKLTKEQSQLVAFLERHNFQVSVDDDCGEIETWTDGGVNMIVVAQPFVTAEVISMLDSFDVDYQIDMHREQRDYRNDFTIRESLEDFEAYKARLNKVVKKLKTSKTFQKYL